MIDIETFGTAPGSLIKSIGAVVFNASHIVAEWERNISIGSALKAGLTVEEGTLRFWLLNTTDEARRSLFDGEVSLTEALTLLRLLLEDTQCKWVWSHGAAFDLPLLDMAYRATGSSVPWNFHNARDTRTLFSLAPLGFAKNITNHNPHKAVDDALYQVKLVKAAYRSMQRELEE